MRKLLFLLLTCLISADISLCNTVLAEEDNINNIKKEQIVHVLDESMIFCAGMPEAIVYGEKIKLGNDRICSIEQEEKLYVPKSFCERYTSLGKATQIENELYILIDDFAARQKMKYKKYGNIYILSDSDKTFEKAESCCADIELLFGVCVSPEGKRTGEGTIANPVNSFESAKNKVKKIIDEIGFLGNEITVYFREGVYDIKESVAFGKQDSAPEGCTIVYDAYPKENPTFSGGIFIPGSEFKRVTSGEINKRLPDAAKGNIYYVNLEQYNYYPASGDPSKQLVMYDGEISTIARYPNHGDAVTGQPVKSSGTAADPGVSFEYDNKEKIKKWKNAKDAWINASFVYTWSNENYAVSIDGNTGIIETNKKPEYQPIGKQKPFYIYNLLEELDAEGEYFIDRENNVLYYYPYKGHVLNGSFFEKQVSIAVLDDSMIKMDGVSGISFRRLVLENTVGNFIEGKNVKNIEIAGCTLRNNAGKGIEMSKAYNVSIKSNDIYNVGLNGMDIGGGNIADLTPSGIEIINNRVFNVFTKAHNGGAIRTDPTYSYGMYVANNEVFNCPHFALAGLVSGGTYEYNELYDATTKDIFDSGVVYTYMYPYNFDRKVQHNYIHDSWRGMSAVYLDNMSTGSTVKGNIFYRTSRPVFSNGGENCIITNNIMIDQMKTTPGNNHGIFVRSSEAKGNNSWDPKTFTMLSGTEMRNLQLTFLDQMKTFNITSEEWKQKNPYAIKMLERGYVDLPYETHVTNNIAVRAGEVSTDNDGEKVLDLNNNYFYDEDIGFVDAENNNFNLESDSEVYERIPEFEKINFDKMGIYTDEYRKELPKFDENFDMLVPADKANNIDAKEVVFKWKAVQNTRKYRFVLACDENFNNIIRDEIVYGNTVTIKNLRYESSRYYWKVEALSMNSKNFPIDAKICSDSKYFSFTTAEEETLVFEKAVEAIEDAKMLSDNIFEGKQSGEYFVGSKDILLGYISEFESFIGNDKLSQREIDEKTADFVKKVQGIKGRRNTETISLNNQLKVLGDWSFQPNIGMVTDGGILFKRASASDNYSGGYISKIENYQMLKFKTKIDLNDGTGAKGWVYYGLRADNNTGSYNNSRIYFVVVNESLIELQRWGSGERLYLSWDNNYIESGKEYDIEYGALDTEDGNVRIIFKVNGETVIDYVDTDEGRILESGYFTVFESRPGLSVYLLPTEEE